MKRMTILVSLLLATACSDDDGADAATDASMDVRLDAPGADADPDVGSPDGDAPDGDAPDASEPDGGPAEGVPVILAQGHVGRTLVSCDEGRTWVADQTDDASVRCFSGEPSVDCDHAPGAGRGLTYDGERWFATFGWGPPGGVRRSADGVTWEQVLSETTLAGIASGQGAIVGAQGGMSAQRSDDGGDTWSVVETTLAPFNARSTTWVPLGEGLFVITGESGDERGITLSDDAGLTWRSPAFTGECLGRIRAVGAVGDRLVVVGGSSVCWSADRGATFESVSVGSVEAAVFRAGEVFAYGNGESGAVVYRSTDGASWSTTPLTPDDRALRNIGRVGVSPDGSFVGAGGWMSWYDDQQFFRSDDGVNWEILGPSAFSGGHPIRTFAPGRLSACPE